MLKFVFTDNEYVLRLQRAGASGYITKNASGDEIVHAIRAVIAGEKVLPLITSQKVIRDNSGNIESVPLSNIDRLTPKEIILLKMVAQGMPNKDIAMKLGLSLRSVKSYLTTIFLKLGVTSRTEAISIGFKTGIITINDLK